MTNRIPDRASAPPREATALKPQFVALLRGINVGPHKRIAMADLKSMLTGLALDEVETILQSGNAVFRSDRPQQGLPAAIEHGIVDRFSMQVGCVVVTAGRITRAIADNPWPEHAEQGSRLMASFLSAAITAESGRDPTELDPATIRLHGDVVYQWCPDGVLQAPPVGTFIEKHWPVTVTARNWNTLGRIAAKLVR